ncbi:MAG: transposase [Candidatus Omnitrophica bacterium]|nr:transposase [Candidatus Omnitrophota bacterium]
MPGRLLPLVEGKVYHILSKSIAEFKIFRNNVEYERISNALKYYKIESTPLRFSLFLEIKNKERFFEKHFVKERNIVKIIAYCFMPTHMHLILKQLKPNGISIFMSNVCNSYTRYFNVKTKRRGPLWESRFKNILVKTDEYLLHLTRYLHLNPATARLVKKPEDWEFSSYNEFLGRANKEKKLCSYSDLLKINPKDYRKFVNSRINYQRKLAKIKKLFLE